MEFLLNLAFDNGKPQAKQRSMTEEPLRGDMLVQACEPNERSGLLRFARVARFCVPVGEGQKVFYELYDPVIVRASTSYMEVHGYEKGEDAIHMQSWILRPTMVGGPQQGMSRFHTGQPGHPGYHGPG